MHECASSQAFGEQNNPIIMAESVVSTFQNV